MVEQFVQIDNELLAVLSIGTLIASPIQGGMWRPILADVKDIAAVSFL